MIHHHPADNLLLGLAAGSLSGGAALLVTSHLEACAHCRDRLLVLEAAGGALLDALEPQALAPDALARTMAAIEAPALKSAPAERGGGLPSAPEGMRWPDALSVCSATPWRWIGPGMRWSRVSVPSDPMAKVFLLRMGAGKKLAMHTHGGCELTQVLHGRFHDGRDLFAVGDFDETDGTVLHQPEVQVSGECICLASIEGGLMFQGVIARTLGTLMGM
ncbi:ChrR family anti-sigma-E factor [Variovorax sp. Sphag1AA]|uniref:ChrR family anti-sigma-E factor n=1 Tax=Variovorax sp. Sphag1AA TaxID=2587027 RepID=UPI001622FB3C|nr:ChrR family anti-sigma-E factor [Variovorax sp. Sphag1AA]MBB3181549.1 putative transcriptional regulator [Variovorax sp. Sphag1AA]